MSQAPSEPCSGSQAWTSETRGKVQQSGGMEQDVVEEREEGQLLEAATARARHATTLARSSSEPISAPWFICRHWVAKNSIVDR